MGFGFWDRSNLDDLYGDPGIGGHFLGADLQFMSDRPEMVNNVLQEGFQGKDLMGDFTKSGYSDLGFRFYTARRREKAPLNLSCLLTGVCLPAI